MSIKRVIFIRPGETDWNRIGRWQGQVAVPLNAHGRIQAERLSAFMRNLGLSALYSSDLRRARDTAEIISANLGFEPIYEPRLRERHIGDWQGLTLDEIKAWYPEDYERLGKQPETFQIPGGESRAQVRQRVHDAFQAILERGGGENIGILSHTTAIMILLDEFVPDSNPYDVEFSNISVTTISREGNDTVWSADQLNDVSHLEGMESMSIGDLE